MKTLANIVNIFKALGYGLYALFVASVETLILGAKKCSLPAILFFFLSTAACSDITAIVGQAQFRVHMTNELRDSVVVSVNAREEKILGPGIPNNEEYLSDIEDTFVYGRQTIYTTTLIFTVKNLRTKETKGLELHNVQSNRIVSLRIIGDSRMQIAATS